jgi:hypothetical protein
MPNNVPYTSYEAAVLQAAIAMLSASATFIAVAAAVNKLPADLICESMGGLTPGPGNPATTSAMAISGNVIEFPAPGYPATSPLCILHQTLFPKELIALNTTGHSGEVSMRIYLTQVQGDAVYEILRRARNTAGGIAADIDALFGTQTGYFYRGFCQVDACVYLDKTTDLGGCCLCDLSLHWFAP